MGAIIIATANIMIMIMIISDDNNNHANARENNRSYVLHAINTDHRVETVARRYRSNLQIVQIVPSLHE